MIDLGTRSGFLPAGSLGHVHWVSPITPNFQASACAEDVNADKAIMKQTIVLMNFTVHITCPLLMFLDQNILIILQHRSLRFAFHYLTLSKTGFTAFKTIWQKGNGAGGIRTPDTVNGITVFKTVIQNNIKPLQTQHLQKANTSDLACYLAFLSPKDPDLAMVVGRWPNLPEHIKAAIKALIQTNITEKK